MSKIIVVTGASVGIGAAILRQLAEEGHQVVGLARRPELIETLAKENPGWKVHALKADVTKDSDVIEAFTWIKNKFGKIDVMINNAGCSEPTMLSDGNIDTWRKMYDLNVFAVGSCIRETLKIISDEGNIINVSSVLGQETCSFPGFAVYSSTKHALKCLTKGLRAELHENRPGIKVTLLNPGLVQTPMTAGAIGSSDGVLSTMPFLQAEDIARAASYIVSTPKFVDVTELTVQHSGEYCK
uniref:Farnesol dehydrogenase n=1 Tax=Cacopsylla melanoneura TaxID=428564 RepID=A0A8D8R2T7_9HEMI